MLNNILKIKGVQELNKRQLLTAKGGGCPTYPASQCLNCGGYPLSNGCCLGTAETHCCLGGGACP